MGGNYFSRQKLLNDRLAAFIASMRERPESARDYFIRGTAYFEALYDFRLLSPNEIQRYRDTLCLAFYSSKS